MHSTFAQFAYWPDTVFLKELPSAALSTKDEFDLVVETALRLDKEAGGKMSILANQTALRTFFSRPSVLIKPKLLVDNKKAYLSIKRK